MTDIIVYTKDHCSYCNMLKNLFDALGISYKEVDISTDPSKIQGLELMTVPQVYVGDKFIWDYTTIERYDDEWVLFEKLGLGDVKLERFEADVEL